MDFIIKNDQLLLGQRKNTFIKLMLEKEKYKMVLWLLIMILRVNPYNKYI